MPFLSIPSAVEILNKPLPETLLSQIKGNAPRDVKEMTVKWLNVYHAPPKCFAGASTRRTLVTEVSLDPNPLDDNRRVLTLVAELDVTEEILDERGKLSNGFTIAVMDECLSSAVTTLDYADGGHGVSPVSLALNTVFYNPAELGAKLRFINTTQAAVAGRMSSRCEVWDLTRRKLVATGVFLGLRSSARL